MPTKKEKQSSKSKSYKSLVAKLPPKKKPRTSLKPPPPSASNQADAVPRLHLAVSASNYGVAFATKGGPHSGDKAYMKTAEDKVCDPTDLSFNKAMNCYGVDKVRKSGGVNEARAHYWKTGNGERRSCDLKVNTNKGRFFQT